MSDAEAIDDVSRRIFTNEVPTPDPQAVLRLYLDLPAIVVGGPTGRTRIRSSFEAAFGDAEAAFGGPVWLSAVGYLCWFDQLGDALRRTDRRPVSSRAFEKALEWFSPLSAAERAALYALRCALAHDYSLVNVPEFKDPKGRWRSYQHAFVLHVDDLENLVTFPDERWNGDPRKVVEIEGGTVVKDWQTRIDLARLQALARNVRDEIHQLHRTSDVLALAIDPAEMRRRYFFTHPPAPEEVP